MTEKRRWLAEHAEDVALAAGTVLLGMGVGLAFDYTYGLMTVGALAIVYGVWITERGR